MKNFFKKILSTGLSISIIFGSFNIPVFAYETYNKGDVNGNGSIDAEDANDVFGYLNGTKELDTKAIIRSDVNADGNVTDADAVEILRLVSDNSLIDAQEYNYMGYDSDDISTSPQAISITKMPDKEIYAINDIFDKTGMQLKYINIDGSELLINDSNIYANNIVLTPETKLYAVVKPLLRGDVDGTGTVTSADASLIARYATGDNSITFTDEQKAVADVNDTGTVTMEDASLVARYGIGDTDAFSSVYSAIVNITTEEPDGDLYTTVPIVIGTSSLEIVKMPAKSEYAINDTFDKTGMQLKYINIDGSELLINDSNIYANNIVLTPETKLYAVVKPLLRGDVNGNGKVDSDDASLIARYATGDNSITFTDEQKAVADVDDDGSITSADASLVAQAALGYTNVFKSIYSAIVNITTEEPDDDLYTTVPIVIGTSSLEIVKMPAKSKYAINDIFDKTGMQLKYINVDGSELLINDNNIYANNIILTPETKLYAVVRPLLRGDVDGNGSIEAMDATLLKEFVAKLITFTDEQKAVADVNGDGYIDTSDISLVKSYISGDTDAFSSVYSAIANITTEEPDDADTFVIVPISFKSESTTVSESTTETTSVSESTTETTTASESTTAIVTTVATTTATTTTQTTTKKTSSSSSGGGGSKHTIINSSNTTTETSTEESSIDTTEEATTSVVNSFEDITNHWAEKYIEDLHKRGIVNGITDKLFSPDASTKRGDFALVLCRLLDIEVKSSYTSFNDVNTDSYYSSAIEAVTKEDIMVGYGDGTFKPENTISREEMIVVIAKLVMQNTDTGYDLSNSDYSELSKYSDSSEVSFWAKPYVCCLSKAGIVVGDNQRIKPHDNITRAEMAVIISNYLG